MSETSASKQKVLLDDYQTGDFFLSSPNQALIGKGIYSKVEEEEGQANQLENLPERVKVALNRAKLAGQVNPVAVGAVPFDHFEPSQLVIPADVSISGRIHMDPDDQAALSSMSSYEMESIPQPEEFINGVNQGLKTIKEGPISKIVLSRSLDITAREKVDVQQLLKNLALHNTQGYTFAVDLPEETKGRSEVPEKRTLVGASPELLVSKSGDTLLANPLAGSRPRSDDAAEDQRRALELLDSAKDLHEHAVVVDMVKEGLAPFCDGIEVPEQPSLVKTEAMWHLSTEIKGKLRDVATSSLELAIALHPTPAVCGHPTALAREEIYKIEPFDRGFFTGMVGWCDANGDGEWIVTIRCAEVKARSLRLYAGAGVVAGSKAEDELAETSAKLQTMLQAMGVKKESLIDQ
ncbi:isochorismate synthase [Virgibacillus halotolerans]|uniref:isochorismate synthase DhbC n=1 Tax=Virgibacillus halotolerans TaxID=1071053 RepID=UPI00195FC3D1|nr:isochorismate synthase DhbC [Virgibacillus halotolerans]MBM7599278.1 isochorismate synthase [Virgibacillus halotolerans]